MTLPKWPRPSTLSNRNESIENPLCTPGNAAPCISRSLSLYWRFRATGRCCWRRLCDDVLLTGVFCALLASLGSNWKNVNEPKMVICRVQRAQCQVNTHRWLDVILRRRRKLDDGRLCHKLHICVDAEILEWLYNLYFGACRLDHANCASK